MNFVNSMMFVLLIGSGCLNFVIQAEGFFASFCHDVKIEWNSKQEEHYGAGFSIKSKNVLPLLNQKKYLKGHLTLLENEIDLSGRGGKHIAYKGYKGVAEKMYKWITGKDIQKDLLLCRPVLKYTLIKKFSETKSKFSIIKATEFQGLLNRQLSIEEGLQAEPVNVLFLMKENEHLQVLLKRI